MQDFVPDLLEEVAIDAPWELVETFSRTPRWKPEDVAGACDLIVERLKSFGVPVTVHKAKVYLSIPFEAKVEAAGRTMTAKPPAYSTDCREGLEAELVHVPATISKSISTLFHKSQDPELSSAERIRGKIVVSEGFSFPGKILEFEQKGAVGVIAVNPGADAHWGICTSIWGTPELDDLPRKPGIPVAAVNKADGEALIAMAEKGGLARLFTTMEEGWYEQPIPEVNIEGTDGTGDFVLLHGHYDSWDVGVGDNATGDATLLECARILAKRPHAVKRGVKIVWWPGHSTGRYAGSTWFADRFALELDEHCVAQVNCDSPGCRWATVFKNVSWMSETEGFCKEVIAAVADLPSEGERPHRAGDYAFNNIGLSSFFMLSSTMPDELRAEKGYYVVGGCGGNIAWHTEHDLMEIADRDHLLRDIKVYLAAVMGVANADVLPFDWRDTAGEFEKTLARYEKAAAGQFDLEPAKEALAGFSSALGTFYGGLGTIGPDKANEVIKRLARILVPINFTRGPRFRHDPALPIPPLPDLALCEELKGLDAWSLGFALTQLTRGQNRVVAALREATRLVAAAKS